MKHAKNYVDYARTAGHARHSATAYQIEIIEGVPCCGLCAYPLNGVCRITVNPLWVGKLVSEFAAWKVRPSAWQCTGNVILTGDLNVADVAIETFIKSPHLLTVEHLKPSMGVR